MSKKRLFIMLSCLVVILLISVGYCAWVISHYVEVSPVYDPLLYLAHELHDQETTYDGTAKFPKSTDVPNITYDDEFSLSYKLTGTDTFTNGCPVNAGIYDFKIKCADSDDSITLTFTINKAPQVINASDLILEYDKQPHQVSATLTTGDGAISYSPTNVINAGTTVVTITAAETDNYLETTKQVNVTINPIVVTLDWQNTTLEYTGSELVPTAVVTNLITGDTCTVTVSGAQTAPGEYTATATALSNSNYQLPTEVTHSFLIKQPLTDVDLFELKFTRTDEFMYRLGNGNNVYLSSLFKLIDDVVVPDAYASFPTNVSVYDAKQSSGSTLIQLNGNDGFNCTISSSSLASTTNANVTSWLSSTTLKFTGTGIAIIELKVKNGTTDYSKVRLVVEVVDGWNTTTATSASSYDIILLNDINLAGSIVVSNNYSFYGNGFTIHDIATAAQTTGGHQMILLQNGTLDNVRVEGHVYPQAVNSGYTNQYFAETVRSQGNSYINNCYISGRRAAIQLHDGKLFIKNTTIFGGACANMYIEGGDELHLDNVTTVQSPSQATLGDTSVQIMGVGTYISTESIEIYLENDIRQFNWVSQSDLSYVPSDYRTIASTAFSNSSYARYRHTYSGTTYVDLGFLFKGSYDSSKIHDNRPQEIKNLVNYYGYGGSILNQSYYMYLYDNTVSVTADRLFYNDIYHYNYEYYKPTFIYDDSSNYIPYVSDELPYYVYSGNKITYVMMPGEEFNFDVDANVLISKYGRSCPYQVYENDILVENIRTFDSSGIYTLRYHATVTEFYDNLGTAINHTEEYDFYLQIEIKLLGFAKPTIAMVNQAEGLWVNCSNDFAEAVPLLQGLIVTYNDSNGHHEDDLSGLTELPSNLTYTVTGFKGGYETTVYNGILYLHAALSGDGNLRDKKENQTSIIKVTYTYRDSNNNSATTTAQWTFNGTQPSKEVKKADFSGSGGGGGCITANTLITLADGSKKMVKDLTGNELLLVWNFETGTFDSAPITFIDSDPLELYEVITLTFSDGTSVDVIYEHGFFDVDLAKYVYLDNNASDYIGHHFVNENNEIVTLIDVTIEEKLDKPYSPTTFGTFCYYVNGMLSMPGGINGMFNYFDIDTESMKYDEEQMANDIALYGELTLEDYEGLINQYAFDAFCGKWLSVSIGKGLITWEDIEYLAERYGKFFLEK